jgi:hypothetical protein
LNAGKYAAAVGFRAGLIENADLRFSMAAGPPSEMHSHDFLLYWQDAL